jgi:predicted nucleic acid-binding Zn ribbon protein
MIAVQRVLPDTLSEIVRRQPLTQAKVDFAWRTAVGPALARVSSAQLDGDGTLRVRTDDDRWTKEIERGRDVIRARLDRLLGDDLKRVEVGGPRKSQK